MNLSISAMRRTLRTIPGPDYDISHPGHGETCPVSPDELDQLHPMEILLVLDARARIQYCSEGHPFQHHEEDIVERPINILIPGLPLREGTPGYNIAYVRCSFANNVWQRHLIDANDHLLPIDLHLRTLPVAGGYCLLGLLRFFATKANDARVQTLHPSAPARQPAMAPPLVACA